MNQTSKFLCSVLSMSLILILVLPGISGFSNYGIFNYASASGSTITIKSLYASGAVLTGMYTVLQQNSKTMATGFTPVTFSVTSGQTYSVTVSDYTNAYFNHWSNGVTTRTIVVTASSSATSLTAVYTKTKQPPPTGGLGITVKSTLLNGTVIQGMYVNLRLNGNVLETGYTPVTFSGLQSGVNYAIVVYWCCNIHFRHCTDGQLTRYHYVTIGSSSVTLVATYQNVPPSKAVSLNFVAELPNGTVIGGTKNVNGSIVTSPGMWLELTPPSASTLFTGAYTGSSSLPFTLFNNETYSVKMTSYGNYHFDHWKDSGSTNPIRSIALKGNSTYIAIYTYS